MKKQTGFTLIEIMIALVIGLIIVAATISIYVATTRGSSDTIKAARLNHDLESVMGIMVNDIRRAGYWGGAIAGVDSRTNPFTQVPVAANGQPNIHIPSATCLLYSYDEDGDGHYDADNNNFADAVDDADEFYGFKLENGAIKMRQSVKNAGITYGNCVGTDCCNSTYGNWEAMTIDSGNENIEITNLAFTTAYNCLDIQRAVTNVAPVNPIASACAAASAAELPSGHSAVETREIFINLQGRLVSDHTVTKNLTQSVKVRNDRIFKQP